jgi:hypothetical protein
MRMQTIPGANLSNRFGFWLLVGLAILAGPDALLGQGTTAAEVEFWQTVKDTKEAAELDAYLKAYPDGQFAPLARLRIEKLRAGSETPEQAGGKGPRTPEEYVARVGGEAKIVPYGELVLDGRKSICGKQPTVLDPKLDDYAASYPGFIILNPKLLAKVSTTVKLWMHAQGCGYQYRGPDAKIADCFAVQRGRRQGWLTPDGMEEICKFIGPTKGDAMHFPGPQRCAAMRACYLDPTIK